MFLCLKLEEIVLYDESKANYTVFFRFLFLPDNVRVILTLNVLNSSEYILKHSSSDVKREFSIDGGDACFLHGSGEDCSDKW